MITQKQLSWADIFSDCKDKFENDKPAFLSFLEKNLNLNEFIPVSFLNHYYASTGRPREYPLQAMLWALILQRIFSIPTDSLLIAFYITLKCLGISAVLGKCRMPLNLPASSRISCWTYNCCSRLSSTPPNRYARVSMGNSLQ